MKIQPANRIDRLPPYILGRLKNMIYERRKAGADVIDMNMGNPTDAPPDAVVEKLREAVLDPRNSRYSVSAGVYIANRVSDKITAGREQCAKIPERLSTSSKVVREKV